jgi:hypothetical protein
VTLSQPGVYVIACKVHTLISKVGVIVVGDPVNIDKIDPSGLPPKAKVKIQILLDQVRNN